MIIVAISYGYFLIAFALWRRGTQIPDSTKFAALAGLILFACGVFFARRESGLWIMIGSLSVVTFYFVVDPYVQRSWIQLSVLLALVMLSIVFMFWQKKMFLHITLIFVLAILNFISYFNGAISLLPTGSFLGRGSISSFMIFSTGAYSLYGWSRMIERAKSKDATAQEMINDFSALEKAQRSQEFWRELVIRVHETTLNTIRSLITLKDLPIENFRSEIEKSFGANRDVMNSARERRSGSVIGAIRSGIDSAAVHEKVRLVSQGVNLHLDAPIAETIERVVREALRNSIEHADAKNIEILWRTTTLPSTDLNQYEAGRVSINITDDGKGTTNKVQGGIGTNLIMAQSIRELGGSFAIENLDKESGHRDSSEFKRGTVVKIELPTSVHKQEPDRLELPSYSAIDLGRYMALLTLFGPAMTGVIFFPMLGIWWPGQTLTQILALAGLVLILYSTFVRNVRLGWMPSSLTAVCLVGSIYFLHLPELNCQSSQPFQWVINSVVYGLFIIFLWGKWQITVISYPIFLYLIRPLHDLIPQSCNFILNFPLLNTLFSFLFVAIIFYLVYISFERVELTQQRRLQKNLALVSEIERNDASFEKILELDSLTRQTIYDLAQKSGPLSIESVHELRLLDAQLRAEMQVDPVTSGGFTVLASDFVRKAAEENRWIEVKSIHGDSGSRAIPQVIREGFLGFAGDIPNGSSIQLVISDGEAELSLRFHGVVPESVTSFAKSLKPDRAAEFSARISESSPDEHVLFVKREKQFQ